MDLREGHALAPRGHRFVHAFMHLAYRRCAPSYFHGGVMSNPVPGVVNHGIQANSVSAHAMATGAYSQAHSTVGSADADLLQDLRDSIKRLDSALAALPLDPRATELVRQDTRHMALQAEQGDSSAEGFLPSLKSLKDKLAMAGVFIADVVALAGPVRAIAGHLGVSLDTVGL